MSAQIQQERDTYYDVLERCQKGTLDITVWIAVSDCLKRAIGASEGTLEAVLIKDASGRIMPANRSTSVSARSSTACWMALKAS